MSKYTFLNFYLQGLFDIQRIFWAEFDYRGIKQSYGVDSLPASI